jgi:hypothetical protein
MEMRMRGMNRETTLSDKEIDRYFIHFIRERVKHTRDS